MDPDPSKWLNRSRIAELETDLLAAKSTLSIAGLLAVAIREWLRQQITLEVEEEKYNVQVNRMVPEAQNDSKNIFSVESIDRSCLIWAEKNWGNNLENLYLLYKSRLDSIDFRMMNVSDKGLALEIYHRIKAGEESFETLAHKFDESPAKVNGGLYSGKTVASLKEGLFNMLISLNPGEVMSPARVGDRFMILQLELYSSTTFNDDTREEILKIELRKWLDIAGSIAMDHLECQHKINEVVP
ncbi:peptidylprolyl isomerase [Prochlorococcus marinus]|uniref:peptidylprolyl isomerase n=1 Tax=Prochlorococcus marinus TaxID=1219 RepID=UPI0007B372B8|nr:peptidylprolyl isomerase [Prochlorococcus marinus]KZR73257.1 hypothetical protein PMIT1320_01848 [Prochlorococcus marinus str. MIT 1320]